jgi:hydrogenase maturation protein HypF
MQRLSGIADYFLIHNRPIVRRCDDSVVRIMAERQIPIRRSRGYVPVPIIIPFVFKRPVLALGAHMHTTIAIGIDNKVYVSQHIGDLETPLNIEFYRETIDDFLKLFDVVPHCVITDLHPAYYSTRYGRERFKGRTLSVQHHHAHIISCMAENEIPEDREVIGFAFDGIGYGTDGSIWGSEVIIASYHNMRRAYHLRPYRLPGGDRATKEPWRVGISLLYEAFGEDMGKVELPGVDQIKKDFILQMIKKGLNSPYTTSMGRLFDGVASIVGLRQRVSYQAQAAIELEDLAKRADTNETYVFHLHDTYIDHRPVIHGIVSDIRSGSDIKFIARKFHNTIVQMIIQVAERLRDETGIEYVALSGGVFQNSIILEHSYNRLREQGFIPIIHQLVPPNDGGLSLGQAVYGLFK